MSSKHEKLCKFIVPKFAIWVAKNNSSGMNVFVLNNFSRSLYPKKFMNLDLGGTGNKHTSLLLNPKKFPEIKIIRVKNKILRNSVSVFSFISKKHNNFKFTKTNDHANSLSTSNVSNSKNSSLSISRVIRKNYKKLQHGQCFCTNNMAEVSANVHSPISS